MAHIMNSEDRPAIEASIEMLTDRRGRILATTKDVTEDGETYIYPRRSPNSKGLYIRFTNTIEGDAASAVDALNELIDYRFSVGDLKSKLKFGHGQRAKDAMKIAENDARELHDALVNALPVQTYALLRELFITIGGRVPLAATEKKEN